MEGMQKKIFVGIGVVGTLACIGIYAAHPSFPTADKLLVFGTFIAMIFSQAKELLKRFLPFVIFLFAYESFRGIADYLNTNVNYQFMIDADRFLFLGTLPTTTLQNLLWHGSVQWYDMLLYLAYMQHFVFPLALAVLIWKTREKYYWNFVTAYILVSFAGLLTFLLFPAAPPWMASNAGYIEPITRISSDVWYALGVQDFPSLYNKIAPNPVAAMPSLHAAHATLFALFITRLYRRTTKWALLAWLYPALIYFGTVYQGEHYAIDEIAGGLYALGAFFATPYVLAWIQKTWKKLKSSRLGKKVVSTVQ